MGVPHRHAEVLKAIADGNEVQWQGKQCFGCWHDGTDTNNPIDDWHLQWRIKPEPKPDVVRRYELEAHPLAGTRFVEANLKITACLECTFDGETGKLKSAEVIS